MFLVLLGNLESSSSESDLYCILSSKGETKLIGIFEECNRKTPSSQLVCSNPYLAE